MSVKQSKYANTNHGNSPENEATDAVRVAVRVRPFNSRELQSSARCIVEMKERQTILHDPHEAKAARPFTFDYSYWSFDGFKVQPDGVIVGVSEHYTDQAIVYEHLGRHAVDNAMLGYNAAIFAYGQTGAGKSFSMVGYNGNDGIIPRLARDLFGRVSPRMCTRGGSSSECDIEYQVSFSMLEIYNEKVTDLLSSSGRELRLRQHPKQGFYVESLQQVAVSTYDEVRQRMDLGVLNRTTAATNMNETSSRSHMVVTLHVKQIFLNNDGQSTTKYSDIHLVDLAGSERVDSATTAISDRLKEGAAINQSLSTLGNVISALAERSSGKGDVVVPYRNSALTKLLHNALGGNSKTVMLAAISPAAVNYEETLSTLRYANRAKQIRNRAIVNESPTDKLIRELREKNARLLKLLHDGGISPERLEEIKADEELLGREMAGLETQWSQQLAAAREAWAVQQTNDGNARALAQQSDVEADIHLSNINIDPQLSHVLKHVLPEGVTLVARLTMDSEALDLHNDEFADVDHILELSSPSILPRHCKLERRDNVVTLIVPDAGAQTDIGPRSDRRSIHVNGRLVQPGEQRILRHFDRVWFGPDQVFLYFGAQEEREDKPLAQAYEYDYDYIQVEVANSEGLTEYIRASSNLDVPPELQTLRQSLFTLAPLVMTANAISAELGKGARFEVIVKTGTAHSLQDKSKEAIVQVTDTKTGFVWHWDSVKFSYRCELMKILYSDQQKQRQPSNRESISMAAGRIVTVEKQQQQIREAEGDAILQSSKEQPSHHNKGLPVVKKGVSKEKPRSSSRLPGLARTGRVELKQNLLSPSPLEREDHRNDPFWDPPEDIFLGSSMIYLQPLAFGVAIDEKLPVTDYRGLTVATLCVRVSLCEPSGNPLPDFIAIKDPSDFVDQRIDILLKIDCAKEVEWMKQDESRGVVCWYRFYTDTKMRTTKDVFRAPHEADFSYHKQFTIRSCGPNFINYLQTNALVIELWGKQGDGTHHLRKQVSHQQLSIKEHTVQRKGNQQGDNGSLSAARITASTEKGKSKVHRQQNSCCVNGDEGHTPMLSHTYPYNPSDDKKESLSITKHHEPNENGMHDPSRDILTHEYEQQMDEVIKETQWLEERRRLQATIEDLQQEVEFLRVEKGQLEKVINFFMCLVQNYLLCICQKYTYRESVCVGVGKKKRKKLFNSIMLIRYYLRDILMICKLLHQLKVSL